MTSLHPHYPSPEEVDSWCADILRRAEGRTLNVRALPDPVYDFKLGVRHTGGTYVAFETPGRDTFYGFWQPAPSRRGPVLLHVPGYGAEMSAHPELVSAGYNVLHINPLGYALPTGPDLTKQANSTWPVLPETVASRGARGYSLWLEDAAAAALWALAQPEVDAGRYAFFGTSQGGGTALLLGSTFAGRGVRCVAADVPFLIHFPMMHARTERGAHELGLSALTAEGGSAAAWKALGFADVMCHAHRLTMPVLLTAGLNDGVCPPDTIRALFNVLPGTRSYAEFVGLGHAYTMPFLHLAAAWFRMHV